MTGNHPLGSIMSGLDGLYILAASPQNWQFLFRVETLATGDGIPLNNLVNGLHMLLSGSPFEVW